MDFDSSLAFVTQHELSTPPAWMLIGGLALLMIGGGLVLFWKKGRSAPLAPVVALLLTGAVSMGATVPAKDFYYRDACAVVMTGVAEGKLLTPSPAEIRSVRLACGQDKFASAILRHLAESGASDADAAAIVNG